MIEEFVSFVIRPPRAVYNPDQHLWEKKFSLAGRRYQRRDLELKNARGYTLRCSHYLPSPFPEDTPLPCVIYCHGNSGCRADANEAAVILLPSNITVFTLDFSGSGLSDGDYVSLGWHEKEDIKVAVSHLRSNKQISCIGLWGRSMGAITCLFYGAEDPSIAGMVIDSAFSNLHDLMMELGDVYEIRVPKFTVKLALKYMRRVVKKKAKFDIKDLNCLLVAPKTFVPVLIGHARDDKFIQPHHSDLIFQSYAGDKNIIKFDGDHNSSRPELFYDSVSSFFNNVFCPQVSSARMHGKYYDLEVLKLGSDVDEKLLHKTKSSLRSAATNAVSSSTAPSSMLTTKSVTELLSEVTTVTTEIGLAMKTKINGMGVQDICGKLDLYEGLSVVLSLNPPYFRPAFLYCLGDISWKTKNKLHGQIEECCSFTSSNRESWGRCSSLGGSDEETTADFRADGNFSQDTTKELGTPLGSMKQISTDPTKEGKKQMKKKEKAAPKTPKRDKFEKLEGLRRNLLCCLLKRSPSKS